LQLLAGFGGFCLREEIWFYAPYGAGTYKSPTPVWRENLWRENLKHDVVGVPVGQLGSTPNAVTYLLQKNHRAAKGEWVYLFSNYRRISNALREAVAEMRCHTYFTTTVSDSNPPE
jgi:hypothetical protein